ncbi:MAG: DUF1501 domain-containing protein [Planctomycetaceae bacterium]
MQMSVPDLMDVSDERNTFWKCMAPPGDGSYASNCLLARRLAERGVRFIHLYHRGWDHHGGLEKYMQICSDLTDRPTYALVTDLKQRGMLDDTLIIWGGEFGRTPMFQGKGEWDATITSRVLHVDGGRRHTRGDIVWQHR